MDDAVKVHPQHEYCSFSSFYAYFPFIVGVLFMSAPLLRVSDDGFTAMLYSRIF